MRRDASRERLFFLLVLVGALLLLSGLMLRHESAALSTRTFRDGFTVAEGVVRRTEIVAANNATDGSATKVPSTEDSEDSEAMDARTMTVKTEDGDEITIKRAATFKGNKVTTIFRDENGKLTIEDTTAEKEWRTETEFEAEMAIETQKRERQDALDNIPISPSAIRQEDTDISRHDVARVGNDEGKEVALVSGVKKITLVQANGSLTEVSLSSGEESVGKEATR